MKELLETGMHAREIYWYKEVMPKLDGLQPAGAAPLPIPKLLGFSNDSNKALVFEDLRELGLVKIPWQTRGNMLR
jgi:hypothetical protein